MARELGIGAVEGEITPSDLVRADEVFITTSVREVVPVVTVDGRAVGLGKPGGVTRRLMAGYKELVQREL